MASISAKRLLKELLDMLDTSKLCEIVRSVYHGGGINVYNREDAEMLLLNQSYERVLSSRRIPIDFILKFLILKGYNDPKPISSRHDACWAFRLLVESQPDNIQPPQQYNQQIQPGSNNMHPSSLDNNMMLCQTFQTPVEQRRVPPESIIVPSAKSTKEDRDKRLEEFIELFAQHFYKLFNNLGTPGKDQLDSRHFYDNCIMAMRILGGSEEVVEDCSDSTSTLQCLRAVKTEHQLFFSPSVEDGVKWKKESHGLVNVHVGGTLHQGVGRMVGMFEQQFILREDPHAANTYKILKTQLMMKSMDSLTTGGPTLSIQESQSKNLQIEYV